MAFSVLVPVFYVVLVFGGLYLFSGWYRQRQANKPLEPYFPRHKERDIYVSLLGRTDPPCPEHLLKAALLRRAFTDVTRIFRIRDDKPALQMLLQKGSVGEDLWNSLLAAEKELEAEILEVAAEANTFVEGWGQLIFQTATEMYLNDKMRTSLEQIPAIKAEKEQKYRKFAYKSSRALPPSTPVLPTPSTPPTPASARSTNGLVPPPNTGVEGSVSSDGDSEHTPSTPRTPKSAKKIKKRK